MPNRMIEKYNLAITDAQEIEMSVAATILGVTIEDNILKLLIEHETAPLKTRKRTFWIVRAGLQLPEQALRFVAQFALDDKPAFVYTDTDDTPSSFAPDIPLVHYQDIYEVQQAVTREFQARAAADSAIIGRLTQLEQAINVGSESTGTPDNGNT